MLDAARDEVDLDALLRDWSLTKADLSEIQRARGPGRLWTALHMCSLRAVVNRTRERFRPSGFHP